ncbi:hypothetical protein A7X75_08205 [Stenotrophomonas maltophilia]|nr:hypothetical protein A7X75_08205 [Stenotrophomonas maltophilia]
MGAGREAGAFLRASPDARSNDAAVSAHRFAPLASIWAEAIRRRFAVAGVPTGLNNPSTCAGIGRP